MFNKSTLTFLATAVFGAYAAFPDPLPQEAIDNFGVPACAQVGDVGFTQQYGAWIPTKPDPTGCGNGYLDDLRGRCGVITTWECGAYNGDGHLVDSGDEGVEGMVLSFWTEPRCTTDDVKEALHAGASDGANIPLDCTAPGLIVMPLP